MTPLEWWVVVPLCVGVADAALLVLLRQRAALGPRPAAWTVAAVVMAGSLLTLCVAVGVLIVETLLGHAVGTFLRITF